MQRAVIIQENQAVTPEDFNKFGEFPRASFDALVKDAVEPGLKFTGFAVVASGPAKVAVGAGRFYRNGEVYYNDVDGGVEVNLIGSLAAVAKKIVAIVVYGNTISTETEPRTFLINVSTRATEAEAVATESRRVATIDKVVGSESSAPQRPAIPANMIAVAYVTVSTTGIDEIVAASENSLDSVRKNADEISLLKAWRNGLGSSLDTIGTDIGNVSQQLADKASRAAVARLMADVARIKEGLHLPDDYVDYGSDVFLDDEESDDAYSGYAARIDNGLNFPHAAVTAPAELALGNPADANVKVTNGLMLPAYDEARVRVIRDGASNLALNQFHYDANTIVVADLQRERVQHGPEMLVSASSSWWGTGRYLDVSRGLFQKNGENFTALPTYEYDASGSMIYRVYSWVKYSPGATGTGASAQSAYWTRTATEETYSGHQWCQGFLNTQDQWITGFNIHFWPTIGNTGNVTLALCETDERAEPNVNKCLASVTLTPGQLALGPTKFPIPPTYVQSGKRYGVIIMTAGNHWVVAGDASGYMEGSLFFRNSGGHWESDPSKCIMLDIWTAVFRAVRTVVPLQPISLAGGLSTLDIMAPLVAPPACSFAYEAQVDGTWYALTPANGAIFNNLPTLVNLRLVMAGSKLIQPGIKLTGSQIIASRAALAMKHASTTRTTPSAVDRVTIIARLEHFDPDHNTCTLKVDRGPGNIETADAVSDRVLADGAIERTAVFNLAASTSAFKRVVEATSDHHTRNFVVSEVTDVSETI